MIMLTIWLEPAKCTRHLMPLAYRVYIFLWYDTFFFFTQNVETEAYFRSFLLRKLLRVQFTAWKWWAMTEYQ